MAASFAFFFSFCLPLPNPNRPSQSERSPKALHEADSFEPAELSERLTPGQSGWIGAPAVGSIPVSLFHILKKQTEITSLSPTCTLVHSASIPFYILRRFVLATSSACFFPFFLALATTQSTVSVRTHR